MGKPFEFEPVHLAEPIQTANRKISTPIPHPEDREVIEVLRRYEPRSMGGQPLILWDRAEGVHVFDRHGNQWLDFSSGVLVTNAGHGEPAAVDAISRMAAKPLHHSYCFPNAERAALVEYIIDRCAPDYLDKIFLLTTGSEATECAIKIARAHAHKSSGHEKDVVVGFTEGFHGRTMGSQMAGGIPALKDWILNPDPGMINAPTPDGFRGQDTDFDGFLATLERNGVQPENVAGVILETYLGGTAILLPKDYMQKLRNFCDEHHALLIFDEVQAGFGRCGKMWGFEHYDVRADMIACGKGIGSGLPISAVIGNSEWMDAFPPGSMTSTHTGNPICCAAALANIKKVVEGGLIENAARLESVLRDRVEAIQEKYPARIGKVSATGLVAAIQMVPEHGSLEPDHDSAFDLVKYAVEHGLMLFAPVGWGGGTVKLSPPLSITEEQLSEGMDVLDSAFAAVCV